jgi:hypothetical protein
LLGYGRHQPERPQGPAPAQIPDENIGSDCRDDHDGQHATEPGCGEGDRGDGIAEEVSEPHPGAGPEQHAADLVDGEPGPTDPGNARERWHDRGEPRDELRDEDERGAVAAENALHPADACVRAERYPAELREHLPATPAAQLVPGQVHGERDHRDHTQYHRNADPSGRCECPDPEQGGHCGEWNTELLGHDESRQDQQAISLEDPETLYGIHGPSTPNDPPGIQSCADPADRHGFRIAP